MIAEAANWMGDVGAGRSLGRYELLVPIAQGGMAVVWAARMKGSRGFQKIVALKSMLPALSEDPMFEEMFLAEAALASRIQHPNVCEILDLGEDEGVLYLVMEWVDGESLSALQKAARSRRKAIPPSVSARVIRAAALGLHAAHEIRDDGGALVGLVHRDVSPQNILVGYDGAVKIVDFGVAKATAAGDGLTQAGQVKGKVPFMAPEQLLGKPLDRRADVFALGICLYQLVTGKHPFRGESDGETMRNIVSRAPLSPPSALAPGVPPALDAAILRAMERDRDERFGSMAELARALDLALPALGGSDGDVADFVKETIGDRGERRRAALRDAQKIADLRRDLRHAGRAGTGVTAVSVLTIPLVSQLTPAAGTAANDEQAPSSTSTEMAAAAPAASPAVKTSRGGIAAVVGAAALLTAASLFFVLRWPGHVASATPGASVPIVEAKSAGAPPAPDARPPSDTAPPAVAAPPRDTASPGLPTTPIDSGAAPDTASSNDKAPPGNTVSPNDKASPNDTASPAAGGSASAAAPASAAAVATGAGTAPGKRAALPGSTNGKKTAPPAPTPRFMNPDF